MAPARPTRALTSLSTSDTSSDGAAAAFFAARFSLAGSAAAAGSAATILTSSSSVSFSYDSATPFGPSSPGKLENFSKSQFHWDFDNFIV